MLFRSIGDFASTSNDPNAGFAQFGFNAGVEYDLLPGWEHFAWSSGFYYITNDYESDVFNRGVDMLLLESGSYGSYALLTGAKWHYPLSDNFHLYAVGQAGYVYTNGPYFNGVPQADPEGPLFEFEMGSSSSTAFSVGIGFLANQRTVFALRYFYLGTHSFSKEVEYTVESDPRRGVVAWEQPMSIITFHVGYSIQID